MMLWSDLKGRKLVSTGTADTVGKVSGFLLDPAKRAVVALELKKSDEGSVVRWESLSAVGEDAVTVADAGVVGDPGAELAALAEKRGEVLKKLVLSDQGFDLGQVKDLDLDPQTGNVVAFVLKSGDTVAGERLLGVGSYAVVVRT